VSIFLVKNVQSIFRKVNRSFFYLIIKIFKIFIKKRGGIFFSHIKIIFLFCFNFCNKKIEISIMPTKLENRVELSKWICYQHNQVNKRLGKELYDCNNNINKLISDYKLV
jgi:hypothetical protein